MAHIYLLGMAVAIIAGLMQFGLYKLIKKKFIMVFIPVILTGIVIYWSVKYSGYSIFDSRSGYALIAWLFGIPAVLGSLLPIIMVNIKENKNLKEDKEIMKIKIGISGYGNIGKSVEKVIALNPDMELKAVFTRRDPDKLIINTPGVEVYSLDEMDYMTDRIDVMILCGGSSKDLPEQGPKFASIYNTVDSFDTHAKIPEYLKMMNKAATNKTAIISAGWDPGLFSMMRMMSGAILPDGADYTFWGKGVSQGHSDVIGALDGVKKSSSKKYAVQYTVPYEDAINEVRSGSNPELTPRQKMLRECYVVAEEGADLDKIENEIKNMPNFFADYNTVVNFITEEELIKNHSKMPHGGFVFRSGKTGENKQLMEFSLKLDSNPDFTASVLVAYARAAYRLSKEGKFGAKTVLDVPLTYLSPRDRDVLIKELL